MIEFEKFKLDNGLRVILHKDQSTQMAAINVLYDVGSRDEDPGQTGFAHLFEHLMFGGSLNIPNYDEPLQRVGGQNNAFTNNDVTNYYITLPKDNIETALWLESDRMLNLAFTPKSLEVQKQVVIEEFKQRYLSVPYGDAWLKLFPLAYKEHPYQWATIGKEISHIENAGMDEVKAFFKRFYHPANAILVISGNIDLKKTIELVEKWFENIPAGPVNNRHLPKEGIQTERRNLLLKEKVPATAIYLTWHMPGRNHPAYYACDLITDLLSVGKSSRFNQKLIKGQELFTELNAFITGSRDPGLIVISGKLKDGVFVKQAIRAIEEELQQLAEYGLMPDELEKLKNRVESNLILDEVSVLNKAMLLAFAELNGDASDINKEIDKYRAVTVEDIKRMAKEVFRSENCSELIYQPIKD